LTSKGGVPIKKKERGKEKGTDKTRENTTKHNKTQQNTTKHPGQWHESTLQINFNQPALTT
jgi:hypothetical protein